MQVAQVCVEPRTSAVNMTLPAAAARTPAAIDRYLLPAPRLRQAADEHADGLMDGQLTVTWTLHRILCKQRQKSNIIHSF